MLTILRDKWPVEMIKLLSMKFTASKPFRFAVASLVFAAFLIVAGCDEEPLIKTTADTISTVTSPAYQRLPLPFYFGIDEPRADAWQDLAGDRDRLREDHFNTVILSPPVLITQRAGGKPRVILEGEAGTVPSLTEEMHQGGLAVFIAPTTTIPGYPSPIDTSETGLAQLSEDALRWAQTAEDKQAELFSPLTEYNQVLGTEEAGKWSAGVLPQIKQMFHGAIVARVVPDLAAAPAAGAPHDFEKLDYHGYDYLMLDVYPQGNAFDQAGFDAEVGELLTRAEAVRVRDGLKGVLFETGSWREAEGTDAIDGPLLDENGQAAMAGHAGQIAGPRVQGFFWHGWTLPGRGIRGHNAEEALQKEFAGPQ